MDFLPGEGIFFFPFAEGGLLFRPGTSNLWVLNISSAGIWCLLPEVSGVVELAGRLAGLFGIPVAGVIEDVHTTLAFFRSEGLLGDGQPGLPMKQDGRWAIPRCGSMPPSPAGVGGCSFQVAGHLLDLQCEEDSAAGDYVRLMAHFQTTAGRFSETVLRVVRSSAGSGWAVGSGDHRCFAGGSAEEILPKLMALTFIRVCDSLKHRLLFHAAVVADSEGAVLFPGAMGSGKTTLAAALASRNYTYFSDELAVLETNSLQVEPFATPMSIKPGSVSALTPFYPGLDRQTIHPRPDGKRVRYLCPPTRSLPGPDARAAIKGLVFPLFKSGGKMGLYRIKPAEALERLAATGSSNRGLEIADVKAMIALVQQYPCYKLIFDSLEEALDLLDGALLISSTTL